MHEVCIPHRISRTQAFSKEEADTRIIARSSKTSGRNMGSMGKVPDKA